MYIYIYICIYVNIQAYLFGLSQPLTTPVAAPPLPGQEPEKVAFWYFWGSCPGRAWASIGVVRA